GWRGLGYDTVPTAHWKIVDGTIKKIANGKVQRVPDGRPLNGGDLMPVETFGDFELSWEWKVTPGANSGVKYNVSEALSVGQGGQLTPAAVAQGSIAPHHSALGFEYQMLDDDRHPDGQLATHRAGALYDLFAPNEKKQLRPVGQWNQSRVVFRGNHGEHWLNGEKIVEFELGTARTDSALAASKYHSIPGFAERRKGHIVLQDHGDEGDFRRALEDKSVDALVIAAPDHWHTPAALLAMQAGKHVYVEKPCGHNAREGELLVEAQRKHRRVVQMGTQQRSAPRSIEIVEAIRQGAIGQPYLARAWYANTRATIGRGKAASVPANLDY